MAKQALDARQLTWFRGLIRSGIEVARSLGCSLVSLGQYTSILTKNGRSLADISGIGITSGNSYTVALALEAIERIIVERGADPSQLALAVVGAGGNIGRTCAGILSGQFERTLLIGSEQPQGQLRLERLAARVPRAIVATSIDDLAQAHVVVSAISGIDAPLGPDVLGPNAIVCDISLPPSVQRETAALRPDITILKGGLARLPLGENLEIASYPLPVGQCFGCLGEALLLGIADVRDHSFTGSVTTAKVQQMKALAQRFGMELVDYKRACVLGTDRDPQLIAEGFHVRG
jgi:predicted amino acid dehydrogenase